MWRIQNGAHYDIRAAERRVGGQWTDELILSTTAYDSNAPDITIGPAGDVVASWRTDIEEVNVLYASRMTHLNGQPNWSEFPLTLPGESAFSPALAVDSAGTTFAAWRSSDDPLRTATVRSRSSSTATSWAATRWPPPRPSSSSSCWSRISGP